MNQVDVKSKPSVYEQIAIAGEMQLHEIIESGNAPHRTFDLRIQYENGLIVSYDGRGIFKVIKEGK
jgi:hypothetical protein